MPRKRISEDELRRLYLDEQQTQREIAEQFGITQTSISRLLKKYGIETRGAFGTNNAVVTQTYDISVDELRRLYEEEKLTQIEIAERLGCSYAAVQRRMYKHNIISRSKVEINHMRYDTFRRDFDGDDQLKAYMLGFCKGDIHVWVRDKNSETIRLMSSTTKDEQETLFRELFEPYGHIYVNRTGERKIARMVAFVNLTFDFLREEKDQIPDWVLADEETFLAFFAGYVDAEGSIGVYNGYAVFKLDTGDKNIIFQSYERLQEAGILFAAPTMTAPKGFIRNSGLPYNQDMWRLKTLGKSTLLALFERIKPYLRHKKRIDDMHKAIANVNERNTRSVQRRKNNETTNQ